MAAIVGLCLMTWLLGHPRSAPPGGEALAVARTLEDNLYRPGWPAVPEREWVVLGGHIGLEDDERKYLSQILAEYDEMRAAGRVDPRMAVIPRSWFVDEEHYFVYVPEGEGPFPALVFLHGTGGNFLIYAHWIVEYAQRYRVVVILPTFGFGRWCAPEAAGRVGDILDLEMSRTPLDTKRLYLCGVSAGAIGSWEVAGRLKGRFCGLVPISGGPLRGDVVDGLPDIPVLAFHGERERIPIKPVRDAIERLRNRGRSAELVAFQEGDHYILLTRRHEILDRIFRWVAGEESAGPP